MALQRPILTSPIAPFDATINHTFTFFVNSGDQVTANEIEVYNNSTNILVFTEKITSFQLQHIVNASTLLNGTQYKIRVRTYNINNSYSDWSDYILFWCYQNAVVSVTNIVDDIINGQTYTFEGSFSQADGDTLQSYKYILYDYSENILDVSEELFDSLLKYQFTGFQNNTRYKIELKTITAHGLENSSGLITFTASFLQPKVQSVVNLSNLFLQGAIQVDAQITQIIGHLDSGTEVYVDNESIDLSSAKLSFQEGFHIDGNFAMTLWTKLKFPLIDNMLLCKIISAQGDIQVKYIYNRIHAIRTAGGLVGNWANDTDLTFTADDTLCIYVAQVDGLMEVKVSIMA